MVESTKRAMIVKTSLAIWATLLLFGVLTMAYGYFNSDARLILFGVVITGATSWIILIQTLTTQMIDRTRTKGLAEN